MLKVNASITSSRKVKGGEGDRHVPLRAQVMYKNRNITDFFKPFADRRPPKRPREFSRGEENTAVLEPKSKSPRLDTAVDSASVNDVLRRSDSGTSRLTSLGSDSTVGYDAEEQDQSLERSVDTVSESFGSHRPLIPSSQRVTRNGEVMIRNSDDDTDSDISLDDIDDILAAQKRPIRSSPPTEPDHPSVATPPPVLSSRRSRSGHSTRSTNRDGFATLLPAVSKYKFSLDALVASTVANQAADASTEEARELIGRLDQRRVALEAKIDRSKKESGVNTGLLASVVAQHGEEDNIDKLMNAIKRTEALHTQKSWSFFHASSSTIPVGRPDFPSLNGSSPLHDLLKDQSNRQNSIVNGFLSEVAAKGYLPDEVLKWMLGASCFEPIESLRQAYLRIVVSAGPQVTSHLTPDFPNLVLRRLGAIDEALDIEHPVQPVSQLQSRADNSAQGWSYLRNTLRLLAAIAEWMDAETRVHTLCLLFRILLDTAVITDLLNLEALEDCVESLVASIPSKTRDVELSKVTNTTFVQVRDSQLQLQLLRCIPTTSPRLSLLRRQLALTFFSEDSNHLREYPPDLLSIGKVRSYLKTTQYNIDSNTDYTKLANRIAILDIGVDDGDPPDDGVDSEVVRTFNMKVDKLAKLVRGMFSRIVDTGASHMTRTEAKEELEAFHSRLIYAVRTKPQPKQTLFGTEGTAGSHGVGMGDFMAKFLAKKQGIETVDAE